ncbi:DUF3237 domain-containing protein [Marinomonas sp. CT5]|uniref:DUF3237 family protein n=1 Tax=Marinomonas sp. CT5 TaxID=2066133 RepID=UPI001BAEDE1D|nr:DUF3237 family protein [Marinomonas sp. CT5]QUX95756.1 DUF3237 domain-containing protein [Marinomonas sp. CT5]
MKKFTGFLKLSATMLIAYSSINAMASEVVRPELGAWPPNVMTPTNKLVLEGIVDLDKHVEIGAANKGYRGIAPIIGGEFHGKDGFKATVRAGGADWQLERHDGVWELFALYSITTDDGTNIVIDNRGVALDPAGSGTPVEDWYIVTNPTFQAPIGKYDWLNKKQFVGTVDAAPDESYVVVRIYEVNTK